MPRFLPLGDAAWTVEFGDGIDIATHGRVIGFVRALSAAKDDGGLHGVIEWVPTFRSVTVFFDPLAIDANALARELAGLVPGGTENLTAGQRWRIPVLFGGEAGPDLPGLASAKGLAPDYIITRMAETVFRVYMLGFMPGFPYMGGLPTELAVPRLDTPRKSVPARTLAVAGTMCAVYPFESPGGWCLLGRVPVDLFFPDQADSPTLFAPGDEVRWAPIDAATFARLDEQRALGRLDLSKFLQK